MKVENRADDESLSNDCLLIEKPCTCTILWCNPPFINVTYVENGNSQFIGKICYPYNFCEIFCDRRIEIFDKNNNKRFTISAECCQCGLLCRSYACESCQTVEFRIFSQNSNTAESQLIKKNRNYLKACFTDNDNYGVTFTPSMNWEDRSLLLAAAMFIDYIMFEW